MRRNPLRNRFNARKLLPVAALGAVALAGATAPATQAAGPPQTINKEVELNCSLVTPFFTVPNLQLFIRIHATVPEWVTLNDSINIQDSYADIRVPPTTAGALTVVSADTVDGMANVFNLALTNTNPATVNVTDPPVPFGPQLVPPGVETSLRVPVAGVLPDVGPITASATAAVGDVVEARVVRVETNLHATSSTNPQIDQNLPFFCDNKAGVDNLVSSIPIQAPVATAPAITGLNPTSGPTAGGTSVVITGTGFSGTTGASSVKFGANNATSYTVDSDTQITAVAPAGTGTVDVAVTNNALSNANTAADNYTYEAPGPVAPAVTGLDPTSGPEAGGTSVVITGTDFTGVTGADGVQFGANNATSYTVDSATQITAVAPAGTGTVDVTVTGTNGTSATAGTANDYTYEAPGPVNPAVEGLAPNHGPAAGGTSVVITGTDFTGATAVKFGANAATSYVVNSATQITAVAPAGTAGTTVDVAVTTAAGTSANGAGDNYTYDQAGPVQGIPTIKRISPNFGIARLGGISIITGTNLSDVTSVKFGTVEARLIKKLSPTRILVIAPPLCAGTYRVTITNATGSSVASAAAKYTYFPLFGRHHHHRW